MGSGEDLLNCFSAADDQSVLWGKLHAVAERRFGFNAICYGFAHSKEVFASPGFAQKLQLKHSFSDEYTRSSGGNFIENDINTLALISGEPFSIWERAWRTPELTPGQSHQRDVAFDCHMDVGVSVLLPDFAGHGVAGICFAAQNVEASEFTKIWAEREHEIRLIASAFDALARPRMIAGNMRLTPRERDVLAYAAAGMGGKAIAQRLGLQPKTVFNTMERARKSLQAASTIEATAKAFVYGLI